MRSMHRDSELKGFRDTNTRSNADLILEVKYNKEDKDSMDSNEKDQMLMTNNSNKNQFQFDKTTLRLQQQIVIEKN